MLIYHWCKRIERLLISKQRFLHLKLERWLKFLLLTKILILLIYILLQKWLYKLIWLLNKFKKWRTKYITKKESLHYLVIAKKKTVKKAQKKTHHVLEAPPKRRNLKEEETHKWVYFNEDKVQRIVYRWVSLQAWDLDDRPSFHCHQISLRINKMKVTRMITKNHHQVKVLTYWITF